MMRTKVHLVLMDESNGESTYVDSVWHTAKEANIRATELDKPENKDYPRDFVSRVIWQYVSPTRVALGDRR